MLEAVSDAATNLSIWQVFPQEVVISPHDSKQIQVPDLVE